MIVLLTCFQDGGPFQKLTRNRPVAMLPVLNRPVIQHHIELFRELGCLYFIVLATDYPLPLRKFLDDGSRWGAKIDFIRFKDPCTSSEALDRVATKVDSNLTIVIPSEMLLDINYENLITFHDSDENSTTRVLCDRVLDQSEKTLRGNQEFQPVYLDTPVDSGILVQSRRPSTKGDLSEFLCKGNFLRITDVRSFWAANMAGLSGQFPWLTSRLQEKKSGNIWFGHHLHSAAQATVTGPSLLGNYVRINSSAQITGWSVMGEGAIVDSGAQIKASVITDHTYIGTDTHVENSIVSGSLVHNIGIGEWVEVSDPFIVADTEENIVKSWLDILVEKALAAIFLVLSSPVWLLIGSMRVAQGKTFFEVREFYVTKASRLNPQEVSSPKQELICFGNFSSIIGRLPGLVDVLRGRIRLAGVRPLETRVMPLYREEWTALREQAPCGLFTPLDADGLGGVTEEEKIVTENYYAATRCLMTDLTIIIRSLWKLPI